jgi:molecular chaperone HscB
LVSRSAVSDGHPNYFALFDLPEGFDVDPAQLAERYRALHEGLPTSAPAERGGGDLWCELPTHELELAYHTLADPIARASYLLDLLASRHAIPSDSSALSGFLMAQIELRESIAEVISSPDPSTSVANILTELAEQAVSLAKELQRLLSDPTPEHLGAAREVLREIKLLGICQRDAEDHRIAPDERAATPGLDQPAGYWRWSGGRTGRCRLPDESGMRGIPDQRPIQHCSQGRPRKRQPPSVLR